LETLHGRGQDSRCARVAPELGSKALIRKVDYSSSRNFATPASGESDLLVNMGDVGRRRGGLSKAADTDRTSLNRPRQPPWSRVDGLHCRCAAISVKTDHMRSGNAVRIATFSIAARRHSSDGHYQGERQLDRSRRYARVRHRLRPRQRGRRQFPPPIASVYRPWDITT
jgi:hypothetical protein